MVKAIEIGNHEIQRICQRYLQTSNKDNGFEVLSYDLKPTSDAPTGYLGRHLYLSVEILMRDEQGEQQLKRLRFFSKSAPIDIASRMKYLEEFGVFKKEIEVYRHILPRLQEVVHAEVSAKCYYADNNVLVFENLSDLDYRMAAGRDGILNYEHLHCLVKNLAALHAGSIIYESREGKTIPELHPSAVVENTYPSNTPPDHMRIVNFNMANVVLKNFLRTMPKYKKNLDFILNNFTRHMLKIFDLAKPSTEYQNVFTHGDLWANNIMFQYGKYGDKPLQCRIVDFQLARYAPPILDLITVLTIPTTSEFRKKYLKELLSEYYRFLMEFLKCEGLNIENYITEAQFNKSIEEYRIAGIIESSLFCHLVILPPEMTQELTSTDEGFNDFFERKRVEICMTAFEKDQVYRERLTDIIEDIVDNFVLKDIKS